MIRRSDLVVDPLASLSGGSSSRHFRRWRRSPAWGLDTLGFSGDAGQMEYPGGKSGAGVYHRIINLMPPHRVYIEPFLGGGAILRFKRPAELNIGIEIDERVLENFVALAGRDGTRGPLGADRQIQRAAPGPTLRCADGLQFLERYKFAGDELVYCDPPYLLATRSCGKIYRHEFSELDHQRLLRCIRRIPARVLISGYWSQMYASALKGWESIAFQATTRGRLATEWLWFNYPPPAALHDYSFLGVGFRERERIKRKKQRWQARLRKLDPLERQALLAVIESEWLSPNGAGTADIARSGDPAGAIVDGGGDAGSVIARNGGARRVRPA
jgi:DNA adenine methylase